MHLAKLLHHKSDFEVVPDIKETADKQMPSCLDLSWSCHQMKTTAKLSGCVVIMALTHTTQKTFG